MQGKEEFWVGKDHLFPLHQLSEGQGTDEGEDGGSVVANAAPALVVGGAVGGAPVPPPVHIVAGWYDFFLPQQLEDYYATRQRQVS